LGLVAAGLLPACGGSAEPTAEDVQAFASRGGVTLEAPSDPGLRISLMMLDGVQPQTKNQRFIKATVFRGGASFGAFCTLRGDLTSSRQRAIVACSVDVATVSDDDNESLAFDLVVTRAGGRETVTLEDVLYAGDGTFLGEEAKTIGHEDERPLALTAREADNLDKNAFAFGRLLLDAIEPLLAKKVHSDEVDAAVAVKEASFFAHPDMSVHASLRLGQTGQLFEPVRPQSALVVPGDLAKGLASRATLTERFVAGLPK